MSVILVVDDSPVDRRLVGGLLEREGRFQVQYAVNGAEALRQIAVETPTLVISDLLMPELDGLGLVGALRERFPSLPVILMTSRGSEDIAVRALQAGAASYVPKRALASELLNTVRNVLALSTQQASRRRLFDCLTRYDLGFVLVNDCGLIPQLVSHLQEAAGHLGLFDEADQLRVGVALEEALLNAMYHGNLEISSSLREQADRAYYDLVEARRQELPFRDRRIYLNAALTCHEARFTVRDEGQGFDPHSLPDPTEPENIEKLSGRGVLLMRTFMDEVQYNEQGNEVTLVKRGGRTSPMNEFLG